MPEIKLRGVTFDHPRATKPVIRSAEIYKKIYPMIEVDWTSHPLEAFETLSIQKLADEFDLIVFDHPFIGEVIKHNSLYSFNELLDQNQIDKLENEIVGNSFFSYMANGKLWALPIDGASQMGAFLKSKEEKFKLANSSIENLLSASADSDFARTIAFPLVPTHTSCTFLTLATTLYGQNRTGLFYFEDQIFKKSLETLKNLAETFNPISFELNPIQLLDLMSEGKEIQYSPFIFGYSPYSVTGFRENVIKFVPSPGIGGEHSQTILGGAGLGISRKCKFAEEAAKYSHWLTTKDVQGEIFPMNLGQPASRSGWESNSNSDMSENFFESSMTALEHAFVRPRMVGWPTFQEVLGEILTSALKNQISNESALNEVKIQLSQVCDLSQENLYDISESVNQSTGVKP
jgi:multiple sugar transport system substrate-binding protein